MPTLFKVNRRRRKVVFMFSTNSEKTSSENLHPSLRPSTHSLDDDIPSEQIDDFNNQDEIVSEDDVDYLFPRVDNTMPKEEEEEEDHPAVPDLFISLPPIRDLLNTETSTLQDRTVQECLPFLAGTEDSTKSPFDYNINGLPKLERQEHIAYLHDSLGTLPARFVGLDASRPWAVYWALAGLCLLGEDVTQYREQVIQTLSSMQNPDGGFGGGHGQVSHCAPSYAAVLSLAMVGGAESLDMIDRRSMWRWLGELKRADGGFVVFVGGEKDVRGAYCSMVMISLLNLPLELPPNAPAKKDGVDSFIAGLPEYLSRCQSFEGGISSAPDNEAHGAFAFCVLACLCILGPPHIIIPKHLDVTLFTSWLSARQYAPEGGFSGRTNKLVDACYSHWVGACWPLLEAALNGPQNSGQLAASITGSLYNREGLIRYILSCCQSKDGGLRDKPSKRVDSYHSCYALAGLSNAQHYHYFKATDSRQPADHLDWAFQWAYLPGVPLAANHGDEEIFDPEDRVAPLHPIYVIPWADVERTRVWFCQKMGF